MEEHNSDVLGKYIVQYRIGYDDGYRRGFEEGAQYGKLINVLSEKKPLPPVTNRDLGDEQP